MMRRWEILADERSLTLEVGRAYRVAPPPETDFPVNDGSVVLTVGPSGVAVHNKVAQPIFCDEVPVTADDRSEFRRPVHLILGRTQLLLRPEPRGSARWPRRVLLGALLVALCGLVVNQPASPPEFDPARAVRERHPSARDAWLAAQAAEASGDPDRAVEHFGAVRDKVINHVAAKGLSDGDRQLLLYLANKLAR